MLLFLPLCFEPLGFTCLLPVYSEGTVFYVSSLLFIRLFFTYQKKDAWVCDVREQADNGGLWNPCFVRNFQDLELGCIEALLLCLQGKSINREVDDKVVWMVARWQVFG